MFRLAVLFLCVALVAALAGFGGVAGFSWEGRRSSATSSRPLRDVLRDGVVEQACHRVDPGDCRWREIAQERRPLAFSALTPYNED